MLQGEPVLPRLFMTLMIILWMAVCILGEETDFVENDIAINNNNRTRDYVLSKSQQKLQKKIQLQRSKIEEKVNHIRIIGGIEADKDKYPFMASLADQGQHECGATLVAPDVFLTAAHCVGSFGEIQLGRYNIKNNNNNNNNNHTMDYNYESFVIQKVVTHPRHYLQHEYIRNDVDPFDFALVKVFGTGSKRTKPVLLNRDDSIPSNNKNAVGLQMIQQQVLTILGWGATKTRSMNEILLETEVNYIPTKECSDLLSEYARKEKEEQQQQQEGQQTTGTSSTLDNTFSSSSSPSSSRRKREEIMRFSHDVTLGITMCAADFVKLTDACAGDSGGPLLIMLNNDEEDQNDYSIFREEEQQPRQRQQQFMQVGVTYSGFGCSHPTLPGLYARTSFVQQWIDETICDLSNHRLPAEFSCPAMVREEEEQQIFARSSDDDSSDNNNHGDTIELVIELELDDYPQERGWVLERRVQPQHQQQQQQNQENEKRRKNIIIDERPILSFATSSPNSVVTERIRIPKIGQHEEYMFTMLDSFGDGHCCDKAHDFSHGYDRRNGYVSVYDSSSIYVSARDSRNFHTYSRSWTFSIGGSSTKSSSSSSSTSSATLAAATVPPAVGTAATIKNGISAALSSSSLTQPFITIVIHLDQYPTETGFLVEILQVEEAGAKEDEDEDDRDDNDDNIFKRATPSVSLQGGTTRQSPVLIKSVYPGFYDKDLSNTTVYETVPLIIPRENNGGGGMMQQVEGLSRSSFSSSSSSLSSGQRYYCRFTMTDNEGDGLFDPGYYQVWLGNAHDGDGTLLFEGREFYLEDTHMFEIPMPHDDTQFSSSASYKCYLSLSIIGVSLGIFVQSLMFQLV